MKKDVGAHDDLDGRPIGRSTGTDGGHRPGGVDDTRWVVVGALEDRDEPFDELEETFVGRRLVVDGRCERPQRVTPRLAPGVRCFQRAADHAQKFVDVRLRGTSLGFQHVTQQSKCTLVNLTTTLATVNGRSTRPIGNDFCSLKRVKVSYSS